MIGRMLLEFRLNWNCVLNEYFNMVKKWEVTFKFGEDWTHLFCVLMKRKLTVIEFLQNVKVTPEEFQISRLW